MPKTEAIYGALPVDLGLIDIAPVEMMFWLYCPIKLPGSDFFTLPPNLKQYGPIALAVMEDVLSLRRWREHYVYITAKTLFVTPDNPGNRPGWHSDGFMTDDLNYIWADANPTLFWACEPRVAFTADHGASLAEMQAVAEGDVFGHRTYPDKHLLRLDQTVIHRVNDVKSPGVRTFVKVSVSRHRYDLAGNSINHELRTDFAYQPRQADRNAPASAENP